MQNRYFLITQDVIVTWLAGMGIHVFLVGNALVKMVILEPSATVVHLDFIVYHQTRNVKVFDILIVTVTSSSMFIYKI